MAAINVKKGDGYICSGTLLGTRESWWQHVLIPASRAYKLRAAEKIIAHQRSLRSDKLIFASDTPSMSPRQK
jgi:hypothetical protein